MTCNSQIGIKEKTASLYTTLLDVSLGRADHPGPDKSRALRPHSGGGNTMRRWSIVRM